MRFITKIALNEDVDKREYPFNIPVLKNFKELIIKSPVTFFVGENGSGKSTLIEAIAIASGLNPEGGSQNFNFKTNDSHSQLYKELIITKTGNRPVTKYFLRAESFYNVASEIDRTVKEDGNYAALFAHGGNSLHECSHGEAFLTLIENRFFDKGLYILDEPESALSPIKQMRLLVLIDTLVKNGSQLIIATHSPILLSYPDATIYDFDNNLCEINYEDTEHYKLYKLFINNPKMMIEKLFNDKIDK
jgi:predicted ATPase